MKTSVIEVPDLLAVLTVDEVEKRLREVPGLESATVNYAGGNATVRYDETRLEIADIKVLVHQRGQAASESSGTGASKDKPGHKHAMEPITQASSAPPAQASSAPSATAMSKDAHTPSGAPEGGSPKDKESSGALAPKDVAAESKPSADARAPAAAAAAPPA